MVDRRHLARPRKNDRNCAPPALPARCSKIFLFGDRLFAVTGPVSLAPPVLSVSLFCSIRRYRPSIRTPHTCRSDDLAAAVAFALRFMAASGSTNTEEDMAGIVAKHLVAHLDRVGFVVMKRPPITGGATLGRGQRD